MQQSKWAICTPPFAAIAPQCVCFCMCVCVCAVCVFCVAFERLTVKKRGRFGIYYTEKQAIVLEKELFLGECGQFQLQIDKEKNFWFSMSNVQREMGHQALCPPVCNAFKTYMLKHVCSLLKQCFDSYEGAAQKRIQFWM